MLKHEVDLLLEDFDIELTEAQLEFLVENRIEFIKNALRDKISTDHDPESANMTSDKIIDHIANKIDPTSRKEHTQWLVNRYKNGEFKLSDSKDMKKLMSKYDSVKPYLENKNLNDMKSLDQLKDNVAVTNTKAKIEDKNSKENTVKPMPIVFESEDATGYKVPNKSTSIHNYGPAGKMCKTEWCTASTNTNMFNGYEGGKYTLHLKNGSVLQLHHQSDQLKDEKDHEIDINNNPRYKDYKDTISKFIRKTHELEGYPDSKLMNRIPLPTEHLQALLDKHDAIMSNPKTDMRSNDYRESKNNIEKAISTNADISDEQFDRLKNFKQFSNDWNKPNNEQETVDKTILIAGNKFAKPEHLDAVADNLIKKDAFDYNKYDETRSISKNLIANPNVSGNTHHKIISEFLKDPEKYKSAVSTFLSSAHNLEPEHFKRLEHFPDAKFDSIINPSKTNKLPAHFYYGTDEGYMTHVANRHDIDDKVARFILDNAKSKKPIYSLVNNPNTPKNSMLEGLHKLKGDKSQEIDFHKVMQHEDLTDDDVRKIVSHYMNGDHKTNYNGFPMQSTRLSREHIRSIIQHPNFASHGHTVLKNPKIKSDDLDLAIDNDPENKISELNVLNSPAVKSKHIDKLIQKVGMNDRFAGYLTDEHNDNPSYISQVTPGHLHSVLDANVNMQHKHRVLHQPGVQVSHFEKVKNNPRFFGAITSSENAPPSILHSLATSPMDHVRQNIAENPNTELRTYQILKNDQNPEIAKIANKKVK